jgi:D-3-phosphoglycerate dehydrogenase
VGNGVGSADAISHTKENCVAIVVLAYDDAEFTRMEQEMLRELGATLVYERDPEALVADGRAAEVDALMVGTERVSANLLTHMPRCRIVSRVGVGLDAIDVDAATAHGIWVANVPDSGVDEVSNHALALLLMHARRLRILYQQSRRAVWNAASIMPFDRLAGQTVGVLGFGRIGQAFGRKARGLGLNVVAHDNFLTAEAIEASGARPVTWQELLQASDYISLHAPLNESTRHIMNADAFAQMKPNAFLVNTARGGLVDADALVDSVRGGKIAGAALDVFETEPLPADSPLWNEEKIFVSPHLAWYSENAMRDVKVRATQHVVQVLRGQPPRNAVNEVSPHPPPPSPGGRRGVASN